ncbi:MAG: hypothetical protein WC822_06490 [Candidatus Paceibacterota bacterium]|jgi:hypothetical protein
MRTREEIIEDCQEKYIPTGRLDVDPNRIPEKPLWGILEVLIDIRDLLANKK